jgi:hypothetical protein
MGSDQIGGHVSGGGQVILCHQRAGSEPPDPIADGQLNRDVVQVGHESHPSPGALHRARSRRPGACNPGEGCNARLALTPVGTLRPWTATARSSC